MSVTKQEVKTAPTQPLPPTDQIPDGGYGWVCVICIFLNNAHHWGIASVSGITQL